ncbi:MAG TPA: hypothetical protein VNL16_00980 [Chloroflexota bacterium]|nr:hypothetical protein [Chloroflexota bacterium]
MNDTHGVVTLQQRRRISARELAVGVVQSFGWQTRVEARERLAQAAFQHHVAVVRVAAFGPGSPAAMAGPCSTE